MVSFLPESRHGVSADLPALMEKACICGAWRPPPCEGGSRSIPLALHRALAGLGPSGSRSTDAGAVAPVMRIARSGSGRRGRCLPRPPASVADPRHAEPLAHARPPRPAERPSRRPDGRARFAPSHGQVGETDHPWHVAPPAPHARAAGDAAMPAPRPGDRRPSWMPSRAGREGPAERRPAPPWVVRVPGVTMPDVSGDEGVLHPVFLASRPPGVIPSLS